MRIWNKAYTGPGLAMSRSLGDRLAHNLGCSDHPDVFEHNIKGNEKYVFLASDGVWEVMENEDIE